jgi:hypothetical protein
VYQPVGVFTGDVPQLLAFVDRVTWNPPGWGSYSGADLKALRPEAALVMLLALRPGSWIPFHTDHPAEENGLSGVALRRTHVVLATNDRCWQFHAGTWQRLEAGHIYAMDPTAEHASINFGETMRVHLIVDARVDP